MQGVFALATAPRQDSRHLVVIGPLRNKHTAAEVARGPQDFERQPERKSVALHTISLFTGGGGLDLGLRIAVPAASTVCYVESGIENAQVLAARIKEGTLDEAPIWSDVRTFDGRPWRGKVDCIVGGFPCQDISIAGKGDGIVRGNRSGLWFEFARIIREVRPSIVYVENVSALLIRGMDAVLGEMAEIGFDAEWTMLPASDCGASHQRKRIFILAHANSERRQQVTGSSFSDEETNGREGRNEQQQDADHKPECAVEMLADTDSDGLGIQRQAGLHQSDEPLRNDTDRCVEALGHTECAEWRTNSSFGRYSSKGEDRFREASSEFGESSREALGHTELKGRQEPGEPGWREDAAQAAAGMDCGPERPGSDVANTEDHRSTSRSRINSIWDDLLSTIDPIQFRGEGWAGQPLRRVGDVGDTASGGMERHWTGGIEEPPAPSGSWLSRCPSGIFPPGPGATNDWRRILTDAPWLAPAISAEEAESYLRIVADGLADLVVHERVDALRMLGNGVVPIQAAAAFVVLARRIGLTI